MLRRSVQTGKCLIGVLVGVCLLLGGCTTFPLPEGGGQNAQPPTDASNPPAGETPEQPAGDDGGNSPAPTNEAPDSPANPNPMHDAASTRGTCAAGFRSPASR